ncbi:MAG: hypothetical protein R2825_23115 [Saprospiraceae bacterium]
MREDIAIVCNRRKVLWSPGCGSLTEICGGGTGLRNRKAVSRRYVRRAGNFVKNILGPQPWTSIMPTGGVSPTEENLRGWFNAGVTCVGMGSQMISSDILKSGDFAVLENRIKETLELIKELMRE